MLKNKIILIGDDVRQNTGVAHVLRDISLYLVKTYDIVHIANGNDVNETLDLSASVNKRTGLTDCSFLLYGNPPNTRRSLLRRLIREHDAVGLFIISDPHQYTWLFEIASEIRKKCPIYYYHVWDNNPYPTFLKNIYNQCDGIGCISNITHQCVNNVDPSHTNVRHIPHGVDSKKFFKQPIEEINKNRKQILGKDYEFILFFNNTNIPRKQIGMVLESFNIFYSKLNDIEKNDVCLLLHTTPQSKSGININTLLDQMYPDLPVRISGEQVDEMSLNNMYNISNCFINIASNEGFGLTSLEATASCTPTITSNTGGLIEQKNEKWTTTIEPKVRVLTGTQKTPYLYSDICCPYEVADAIYENYQNPKRIDKSECDEFLTRKKFKTHQMCTDIHEHLVYTIKNYKQNEEIIFKKI